LAVVALAFLLGLAGCVLSLLGAHARGAILMGFSSMALSACVVVGAATDNQRPDSGEGHRAAGDQRAGDAGQSPGSRWP
jgi:hypothetical protein